ncbi:unnamed protein product [Rotaria sp. Silwood2]|nr:unnamed protein product [Rotaria sp. Silwood2]CAF4204294.1 unnamed protein product [Rotaria sp. Silwood2]
MPNLRIFDIHHNGIIRNNQLNSSFWSEKQWFLIHQHNWQEKADGGIFYSKDSYRRKDYTFYWQANE